MKIGIDIDDTTFYTFDSFIKYADKFQEEICGAKANKDKIGLIKNSKYLDDLYCWDGKTKLEYFKKYYKNVLTECTLLPNANSIIRKLKDDGNTIHFITARLMNINNCNTKKITEDSLEKYGIPYNSLDLDIKDKVLFSKENNIDIFVEDSFNTCKLLRDNGIKPLLMTTKINEKIDSGGIKRVNNWDEVYTEIKNMYSKK